MTIRELKEMVNKVDEKYLDESFRCYYENYGGGIRVYDEPIFDSFIAYGGIRVFSLTLCSNEEDYKWHETEESWPEASEYDEDDY